MPEKTCPYCGEAFDAASESTESCRKAACVKANQRAKKRAAAGVTEVKRGRPKKAPDVQKAQRLAVGPTADYEEVMSGEGHTAGVIAPSGPKHHGKQEARRIAAGDVNALARKVILSRVKTKMPQEDSIEDRLKRLEQAMKQFASKKKPTKEQS